MEKRMVWCVMFHGLKKAFDQLSRAWIMTHLSIKTVTSTRSITTITAMSAMNIMRNSTMQFAWCYFLLDNTNKAWYNENAAQPNN